MIDEVSALRVLLIGFLLALSYPIFRREFYLCTTASEAFVYTFLYKMRVIRDGGCWFFSHFNTLTRVPLSTFRLDVTQRIIDRDRLEAIIDVAFYLRILDHDEGIQSAAASFTEPVPPVPFAQPIRVVTPYSVGRMLEPRLESYLRRGASSVTLEELLSRSVPWLQEGQQILSDDLYHQGLSIESITLTRVQEG